MGRVSVTRAGLVTRATHVSVNLRVQSTARVTMELAYVTPAITLTIVCQRRAS